MKIAILTSTASLLIVAITLAQNLIQNASADSLEKEVSVFNQDTISLFQTQQFDTSSETLSIILEQEAKATAAKELEQLANEQGSQFSKTFATLNPYDDSFPDEFAKLLSEFPLATKDPFASKLIDHARRILKATGREKQMPETDIEKIRQNLENQIRELKKNFIEENLLTNPEYLELKRKLEKFGRHSSSSTP